MHVCMYIFITSLGQSHHHPPIAPPGSYIHVGMCAETVMGESALNALDAGYLASRALRGPVPYTVDRGLLRKVLMKGLEGDISWGKTFQRYEVQDDKVTAYFEDGSSATGTLLVGADGSRSLVRKQYLPDWTRRAAVSMEGHRSPPSCRSA
ncbi:hypothetical protein VTN77DRAFT_8042 [Rasamsonia byssochlamydoides]|uniref:uncharacterized protein n=1 Tax=Rasamsonia byssochlamydoides TaxID=89139 RepID=UPI003742E2BD